MKVLGIGVLAILGLAMLPAPIAVAQSSAKPVTLGILWTTVLPGATGAPVALVEGLRDLGYREGPNLKIEFRHGDGTNESLPKLADELVNLEPDVIVAGATPATIALKKATSTIPIVMIGVGNPVEVGLVQSLAHPGSNVTGRSNTAGAADIGLKRLQLIAETLPRICCLTHLVNPSNPANLAGLPAVTAAEKSLGIEAKWIEAANPDQLDQVLAAPLDGRFDRVLVPTGDALFWAHRTQIAEAALRRGIALFGPFHEYAEAGALMAYGVDNDEELRAVAVYVDRILKGAKPADLPVEQPTRFRLVINLKTAKALGLAIPRAILQRADEIIE